MYVPGASTPEFFQLRLGFVTSTSCGRAEGANSLHRTAGYSWVVRLSGALQRNAKHEARLSNISVGTIGLLGQ